MRDKYDIIGIGNILMDILIETDDKMLLDLGLQKGIANLPGTEKVHEILSRLPKDKLKMVPGGCIPNTLTGMANLGAKTFFIGRVGNDEYGKELKKQLDHAKIDSDLSIGLGKTGICVTFVTPDAERTFALDLGEASNLKPEDIDEEKIKNSKMLYFTGYEIEGVRDTISKVIDIAKRNDKKIAFDLADPNLVKRSENKIKEFIDNNVDILFANEEESHGVFGKTPINCLNDFSKTTEISIVKVGIGGAYIKKGCDIYHAPIYKADVMDTTGAGDMFAAGFLFGLVREYDLEKCGNIGSFAASKVIEVIGAKLPYDLKDEIKQIL